MNETGMHPPGFLSASPKRHMCCLAALSIQLVSLTCDDSPCSCLFKARDRGSLLLPAPEHMPRFVVFLNTACTVTNNFFSELSSTTDVSVIVIHVKKHSKYSGRNKIFLFFKIPSFKNLSRICNEGSSLPHCIGCGNRTVAKGSKVAFLTCLVPQPEWLKQLQEIWLECLSTFMIKNSHQTRD